VLAELKKINPAVKAVMISGFGDAESAQNALKQGAFDYVSKPFKVEDVIRIVKKAVETLGLGEVQAPPPVSRAAAAPSRPEAVQPPSGGGQPVVTAVKPTMNKSVIGLVAAGLLLLAAAGIIFYKKAAPAGPGPVSFTIPYSNPAGMCWIKPGLWVSDRVTGNIYQHSEGQALPIVSIHRTANAQPAGLAFDGESLWSSNPAEKRIYKHKMDKGLTVEAIYAAKDSSPAGLYFDGTNLWELDTNAAKIYKHKMDETLSVTGVFDSPAVNPCGMFAEGGYFYIGDSKTSRLYKVTVENFSLVEIFSLPEFEEGGNRLADLAWDGSNIWAAADGAGKIFKIPLASLKKV